MADGSRHSLYLVEEGLGKANYGVTPATPAFKTVRNTGVTLGLAKDSLQSEEIRSDRQIADFRLGANQVGGDINFELSYGSFDDLLLSAMQSASWGGSTRARTDEINSGVARRSFSMLRHFADLAAAELPYYLYKGIEVSAMSINFGANAMVTGSFSVLGQSQTLSETEPTGATYPAVTTSSAIDAFTGALKDGNTDLAVVTEATINIDNGLGARFVIGKKDTIYPESGRSNVTGSITAYFENSSLVKKFLEETASSLTLEAKDTDGNSYTFILPRIIYTGGQPDVQGEGSVVLTLPFQATLDPTMGTNLRIQRTKASGNLVPNASADVDTIVFFGASITESFANEAAERTAIVDRFKNNHNITVDVFERATGGDNTTTGLTKIDAVLADYTTKKAVFIVHMGGNDQIVGAYDPAVGALMKSNLEGIVKKIQDAGHYVALSTLTKRIAPSTKNSLPYNTNIISPLIADKADIPLDLYKLSDETTGWHLSDGVHVDTPGQIAGREYLVDTIAPYLKKDAAAPTAPSVGTTFPAINAADIVINFGPDGHATKLFSDGSNTLTNVTKSKTGIKSAGGTVLTGQVEYISKLADGSIGNLATVTNGVGNPTAPNTGVGVQNDGCIKTGLYLDNGKTAEIKFDATLLESGATYKLYFVGSRTGTDSTRRTKVTVGTQSVVIPATDDPVKVGLINGVTVAQLVAGIKVEQDTGATHAYMSILQLVKE